MNDNLTVRRAQELRALLFDFIREVRKYEEDQNFKEYCEGVIQGARACLGVISGD